MPAAYYGQSADIRFEQRQGKWQEGWQDALEGCLRLRWRPYKELYASAEEPPEISAEAEMRNSTSGAVEKLPVMRHCSDQWTTPAAFVSALEERYGPLHDLCPYQPHWAPSWHWDALAHPWPRDTVGWINVPFSKAKAFLARLLHQWRRGCSAVMLLPASAMNAGAKRNPVPPGWVVAKAPRLAFGDSKQFLDLDLMFIEALQIGVRR